MHYIQYMLEYCVVSDISAEWGISERSVRDYCAKERVNGAFLDGKTWRIPKGAPKPFRISHTHEKRTILSVLQSEMNEGMAGGLYHRVQIDLTYNSNHIEGSTLTHDQTRYIFETNTIGVEGANIKVDDIVETANHFRCVDEIIQNAEKKLSERLIKELHFILKNGTTDSRKSWFKVGDYKKIPNEVGGRETAKPEEVASKMRDLIQSYNSLEKVGLEDILDFHVRFEQIHPFQDGNGRIGRLLMFKECLHHAVVPFIIQDANKLFYYRGISEWHNERGFLRDTCLSAQDDFKQHLDYFRVDY